VIGVAAEGPVATRYVMTPFGIGADIVKAKIDMKILVTGSAGALGRSTHAISGKTRATRQTGLDIKSSPFTPLRGIDRGAQLRSNSACKVVDVVLHTATLHKPHIASHTRQDFVDTNISGTLNLLEEAVSAGVKSFVFYEYHQRVWPRSHTAGRCAGGVDYGGGRTRPQKHLWPYKTRR